LVEGGESVKEKKISSANMMGGVEKDMKQSFKNRWKQKHRRTRRASQEGKIKGAGFGNQRPGDTGKNEPRQRGGAEGLVRGRGSTACKGLASEVSEPENEPQKKESKKRQIGGKKKRDLACPKVFQVGGGNRNSLWGRSRKGKGSLGKKARSGGRQVEQKKKGGGVVKPCKERIITRWPSQTDGGGGKE